MLSADQFAAIGAHHIETLRGEHQENAMHQARYRSTGHDRLATMYGQWADQTREQIRSHNVGTCTECQENVAEVEGMMKRGIPFERAW